MDQCTVIGYYIVLKMYLHSSDCFIGQFIYFVLNILAIMIII